MMKCDIGLVYLLALAVIVSSKKSNVTFQEHMQNVLGTYIKEEPPKTDGPTDVKIGIYINSLKVHDEDMKMEMNLYLRCAWKDSRLEFDPTEILHEKKEYRYMGWNKIWIPDIFYRNAIEVTNMESNGENKLLKINSTGHVWFVQHQKVALSCPMSFPNFPMTTHACPIMFESFGYTMDSLYLSWLPAAVDIDRSARLYKYTLKDTILYDCSQNYTGGAFPCLEARFVLKTDKGFYNLWVIFPSVIIVSMSWMILWMGADKLGMRLILGINLELLLFLLSIISSRNLSHAYVSYVTAADIWSIVCMLFIFATMLESTIVNVLLVYGPRKEQEREVSGRSFVDIVCRAAFPACFVLFMAIYFGLYY